MRQDERPAPLLLEDVAGSPWLPEPMQHWARAWVATIAELTDGRPET
jgi:hypothetical protein